MSPHESGCVETGIKILVVNSAKIHVVDSEKRPFLSICGNWWFKVPNKVFQPGPMHTKTFLSQHLLPRYSFRLVKLPADQPVQRLPNVASDKVYRGSIIVKRWLVMAQVEKGPVDQFWKCEFPCKTPSILNSRAADVRNPDLRERESSEWLHCDIYCRKSASSLLDETNMMKLDLSQCTCDAFSLPFGTAILEQHTAWKVAQSLGALLKRAGNKLLLLKARYIFA